MSIQKIDRQQKVSQGTDLLLDLFKTSGQPLFPRKMSTAYSNGKMFIVTSKEQILEECRTSQFKDCRINLYPLVVDADINTDVIPPSIMFFDQDRNLPNLFRSDKEFESATIATKNKIKEKLNVEPTLVLWTGGGIHFYVVLRTSPLQRLDIKILDFCNELNTVPSKEFLRFTEQYFTNEKCDPKHEPSIRSCLGRIPYTFNSKYKVKREENEGGEEVTVLMNNLGNKDVASINANLVREFKVLSF